MHEEGDEKTVKDVALAVKETLWNMKIHTVKRAAIWGVPVLLVLLEILYGGQGPLQWGVEVIARLMK